MIIGVAQNSGNFRFNNRLDEYQLPYRDVIFSYNRAESVFDVWSCCRELRRAAHIDSEAFRHSSSLERVRFVFAGLFSAETRGGEHLGRIREVQRVEGAT